MTHDPHTAHAYASMSGGETNFRAAKSKAENVPHEHRAVVKFKIPREWAEKNINHEMRGNMDDTRHKLTDKSSYERHAAEGKPDHEHYRLTELRFKDKVPAEFIEGHMKRGAWKRKVNEDAIPTNHVGDASAVAGLGSTPPDPPIKKRKKLKDMLRRRG